MRTNQIRSWTLTAAATSLVLGCFAVASTGCSDDEPGTKPVADSGTPAKDTGAPATDSGASTLYTRLGGNTGIKGAVDLIVTEELKDPEIASYFFSQVQSPVPAGHPTAAQISACLVNQLGQAAGGPEKYPGVPADNAGHQCRDMTAAHVGLGIPAGTFDKFVTIAAGVLKKAGVADADIATVGSVLVSTKAQVVQDTSRESGPFLPKDAGGGG